MHHAVVARTKNVVNNAVTKIRAAVQKTVGSAKNGAETAGYHVKASYGKMRGKPVVANAHTKVVFRGTSGL